MSEEDRKIIEKFVNSDEFYVIDNYISKPYYETIEELEQENQHLKNDNAVMKAGLIQIRDERLEQYKSILDEIREYIKECTSSPDEYENFISKGEVKHLLQILDKVKENDNKE